MNADYNRAVERYGQRVYAFASYSLRSGQDADDVTQEVLIKLWRNWRSIDPDKMLAWLMRVTRNAVIDHIRRQRLADSRVDHRIDPDSQAVGQDHNQSRNAFQNDPPDESRDRERLRQALLASIQALDEPFRSLLVMRDIQGMPYADIQGAMELSESQVKVYLHRGRRKLRGDEGLRSLFERVHGISHESSSESSSEPGRPAPGRNDKAAPLAAAGINNSG